ncbi:MAG: FumA C-terminus/TtdB family hydratase beta subunit [Candidatus Omnitrophica bacterium]|jgi:fumarate hydratase subunit beta|nr:FumA C-terminus/TtdB family hydratase beta subunit [Candidatus Omnitrophota bacterium]
MMRKLLTPLTKDKIAGLKAGEQVLLSGIIYTARDQAHKLIAAALSKGGKPPVELSSCVIYYCGPSGTPEGKVIGSCGPTTSSRMDAFAPLLLEAGVSAMIGKGGRSDKVVREIKRRKAVYFITYAGCGALLARTVRKAEVIAYSHLGPEAVYRLEVEDFPLIVAIDSSGRKLKGF